MPIQILPGSNESSDGYFYLKGNANTDGSWRALVDQAGAMSFQFRQSGAWVNKGSLPQGGGTFRKILRDGDDLVPLLDASALRTKLNISDQGAMDGRSPTLAVVNDYLAWQYPGDASWKNLIAVADLMPEPVKGDDGLTPALRTSGNELQASYDAGQTWSNVFNLQALKPADGLDGNTPQLRTTSGVLQGSYDGVTWFDMFDLASLRASDGRSAIMRVSDGQVQWQLQGDGPWSTLFSVPRDGENGPANILQVGSVQSLPSGSVPTVSITGTSPNQIVNFAIPEGRSVKGDDGRGVSSASVTYQASTSGTATPTGAWSSSVPAVAKGQYLWTRTVTAYTDNTTSTAYSVAYQGADGVSVKGDAGPANALKVGTVSTGSAAVSITGDAPNQTINFTLPAPTNGTNGISYTPQTPVSRTINTTTAFQHTDTAKPYKVIVNARSTQTVTLLALSAVDKVELRIGPTAASVAAGASGGFSVGVWETGITGLSVMVGASIQDGGQMSADVPAGWFFRVNVLSGSSATIVSCFTQSLTP